MIPSKFVVARPVISSSKKAGNLDRHLLTCEERAEHMLPENVYQLRETLGKLNPFDIPYTNEEIFKKLAIFQ